MRCYECGENYSPTCRVAQYRLYDQLNQQHKLGVSVDALLKYDVCDDCTEKFIKATATKKYLIDDDAVRCTVLGLSSRRWAVWTPFLRK